MEKIYEEKRNNKKNGKFYNFIHSHHGRLTCLVLLLAVFACASLVMFRGDSYAITDIQDAFVLPDTFTSSGNQTIVYAYDSSGTKLYTNVPLMYTDGNVPIFCLEKNVDYATGVTYTKGNKITDYGLMYLLANLYPNVSYTGDGKTLDATASAWLTQNAIWTYQKLIGDSNNSEYDETAAYKGVKLTTENTTTATAIATSSKTFFTENLIDTVISDAVKIHNSNNSASALLSTTITPSTITSSNIHLSSDSSYYLTDAIQVTTTSVGSKIVEPTGVSVAITTSLSGVTLVDSDGNTIDTSSYDFSSKPFYIKIPASSITSEEQAITVNATSTFKTYTGYYYVGKLSTGADAQTVTTITTTTDSSNASLSFKVVGTPDTAATNSKALIIIGLVVLVSGMGIIYANVKPRFEK